jgi:mRNA interferase RelE/StbE
MPYTVEIIGSAAREIRNLERPMQRRVLDKIDQLKENPRPHGVKKLQGTDNLYRIRVGAIRIIYQINDAIFHVLVVKVADRKDVYR